LLAVVTNSNDAGKFSMEEVTKFFPMIEAILDFSYLNAIDWTLSDRDKWRVLGIHLDWRYWAENLDCEAHVFTKL
jgi:hypothetical protein